MINYTASPLDSNKTLLQAFHDIETYLKNNPIYKVYTANIGYTPGTNTYSLSNINVGENTIAEHDVIFFNNAYVGVVSAVGSTEITVNNVTDLRGPAGAPGAKNLLKGDVTVTVADGSLHTLSELGYPLGISANKSYKVVVEYNSEIRDILIKSSDWHKSETSVGGIVAINDNVRIVVLDGMSADRSINPNTSCLGIDRGGTSGSLTIIFKSITEYEEVIADKVKNKLTITVNGEAKEYDGSEAVEVDINTGANGVSIGQYCHSIFIRNTTDNTLIYCTIYNNDPNEFTIDSLKAFVTVKGGYYSVSGASACSGTNYNTIAVVYALGCDASGSLFGRCSFVNPNKLASLSEIVFIIAEPGYTIQDSVSTNI